MRIPTLAVTPFLATALFLGSLALPSVGTRPASADTTYELKIATLAPGGTPWEELLKNFKKAVEKASGGRIKVKLFPGGTLGDENTTVRMVARGQIQGVGASTGSIATIVKEVDAIETPFLFSNASEADYILDKVVKEPLEKLFRAKGLVLGFWSENGFRHFGAKWGAVTSPADLKSRKVRSQENWTHIEMWKALEASLQAIPTPDVATALKTGAVEGYDQSLLMMWAAGWTSQIKTVTLSAHIYQPAAIAFNQAWFDALPADLQKVLLDEGQKVVRPGRASIRAFNTKVVNKLKKAKVEFVTWKGGERKAFVAATKGVKTLLRNRDSSTAAIVDLIDKGLATFRAQ